MSHQNCCFGYKSTDKERKVMAQSAVMTVVNNVVVKSFTACAVNLIE